MLQKKILEIFDLLDKETAGDKKTKAKKFFSLLEEKNLILYDKEILKENNKGFDFEIQNSLLKAKDFNEVFQKLASLIHKMKQESVQSLSDMQRLVISLLTVLKETTSKRVRKNYPQLFDFEATEDSKKLSELKEKWEFIVKSQGHILTQKRIVSIIVRLTFIANFYDKDLIQKLADVLLEIPEAITDADILEQLEIICTISEGMQKSDCKIEIDRVDKVLKELQNTVKVNIKEIEQLYEIKGTIENATKELSKSGEMGLDTNCAIRDKIVFLDHSLKKKEKSIKELNHKLQELTNALKIMEERSQKDSLTNLYNRFHIDRVIKFYETEFVHNHLNYSILFFDIDGFKAINDQYGHLVGDKLLEGFSQILRQNSRSSDIIGRYGGDEFLILMPNTSVELAKDVAIRICKAVAKEKIVIEGKEFKITTSIGVSHRKDCESREELLKKADILLYKAKKGGRNQVQWE
ncbi:MULTISPECIES: GGDEF domain-containing protein [unclassified Helicobacter]|uniref:GGDEF domain-containing protein n=1 Tax=unclassified Helicobacter TaxID=2593540 RepID=UPI000CF19EA2|nr:MULTISPECIES: GGDEF domain-containing protein [unclassified Helicobacter]